jgi:hypothetical protein
MPAKEISRALKHVSSIPEEEIPRFFELLLECGKESETTKREIKKYDSVKEVMLAEITAKYSFYEFLFSKIFAERQDAIKKDFEIIDEGMRRNDRDLIAAGVDALSRLVVSNPIADIDKLHRLLGS